jgi:hypothetical protein
MVPSCIHSSPASEQPGIQYAAGDRLCTTMLLLLLLLLLLL